MAETKHDWEDLRAAFLVSSDANFIIEESKSYRFAEIDGEAVVIVDMPMNELGSLMGDSPIRVLTEESLTAG